MEENTRKLAEPTLEEKRALLERMLRQRTRPASRRVPASYAQQRLWLLTQLDPDAPTFNLHYAVRLRGRVDADALQAALTGVVKRHGSLRTTFEATDGRPDQVVHPEMHVPLECVDFSDIPLERREEAAREMAVAERRKPFDLSRGPLLRAILQRVAKEEFVLFLVLHHIVADGWSIGLLFNELGRLYKAAHEGTDASLEPLPLQFFEFSRLQREALSGDAMGSQLEHWARNLASLPPPLDLPIDGRRTASQTLEAETRALTLDAQCLRALKELSRTAGATPYAAVLMILQVLLQRICGDDDVVVGSPVAARTMANTEALIGFFVNMLVLRSDLSGNPGFETLLERVRDVTRGAFANQDLPFERLLEELNPERDLARTPIFQVYLNMLSFQGIAPAFAGLEAEPLPPYEFEANFDLTLYAQEEQGALNLSFVYRRGLFSGARIEELLRQFKLLTEAAVADHNRRIGQVSLVTTNARGVLPDPVAPIPDSQSPGSLTALRWPASSSNVAVKSADGAWTYGDLQRRADGVARTLLEAGLQRGEVVGIHARRDPWLVAAMLGVLRAGGAFAIFDPAYPDGTLVARWEAANPRALIVIGGNRTQGSDLAATIARSECRLQLDLNGGDLDAPKDSPETPNFPVVEAEDLAYVAFTSGTTGGVKAIAGTHGPVVHFLEWQKERFGLGPEDRFSLLSGLSHDPLLRDVFAPLWAGGTLCVPGEELTGNPLRLAAWIEEQALTVMHLTPAMVEMLGTAVRDGGLAGLRYAFVGGEVLRADTVRELRRVAPGAQCVNFYGATETPQAMGYYMVPAGEEGLRERIPVGRGIDGVQLLVINKAGMQAGIGELGEIVVRTRYLSKGYLGDAELTNRRFTASPLSGDECDRVYWTGDLARYLPDGAVDFAGRRDNQIKLRGFRIEAGEVEAALCTHPDVARAAVVLHGAGQVEGQLVAHIVAEDGKVPDPAALRQHVAKRLPEYAVPAHYVVLDALPLTPNGKVDRRALPPPDVEPRSQQYQAPRTPTEELVTGVYAEVLGLPRVGRLDGFFDLGGHSLLAARVIARLNNQFQVALSLRALFEAATAAELAARIDQLLQAGETVAYQPIEPRDTGKPAPLSYSQERLWYLQQLAPQNAAYNLAGALELRGPLDERALELALRTIIDRHEPLRTRVYLNEGEPCQGALSDNDFDLRVVELPGEDSDKDLQASIDALLRQPFQLEVDAPFRVNLFRTSPTRHVLLFVCHHMVTDGWSMGVFVRELGHLYNRFVTCKEADLPALPIQYADYAAWQRNLLRGDRIQEHVRYWRDRLAGAPPHLELPVDRLRPPNFSYRGARYGFLLPARLRDRLISLSRQQGATLFMTLLATFQLLLARYSNQQDIVVGTPVANRLRPESEGLIGFFVNMLALRTEISDSMSYRNLLKEVRETCLGAYAHQELPFEKLVEELNPARDLSRNPIFQAMFVLQNMDLPAVLLDNLDVANFPIERAGAQMDLTLYAWESESGLHGIFEYATDLFDEAAIVRLSRHFEALLESVVEAPDSTVSTLSIMGDAELREMAALNAGRETQLPESLPAQFAVRAKRTPEAVAVRFGERRLSYAELDRRSTELARYLSSAGLPEDALVGLYLNRSESLLVGVLGVMKAGAAYLPLDPSFPSERLEYMLEDSGACLVVTESGLAGSLPDAGIRSVFLDSEEISSGAGTGTVPDVDPERRAYVIYTSGSTGRPKGVEVTHRNLSNFLASMLLEPGLSDADVLCAVTTLSFDISMLELLLPLTVGATVVVADRETAMDGRRLSALLKEHEVTVMQATPATWRLLIESGWVGTGEFKVLCGGEALPEDLLEPLQQRAGEVWNLYGPTETTIWSTCGRLDDGEGVHIGRPIGNTSIYIVDRQGKLQPIGVPGEIWIGGEGVARGYLGRAELTAERFLPDPFRPGARVYRTGDLGRWRHDGRLQHLGRIDNQVKVRGFRIEPGEIESRLCELPAVEQAVVSVWQPTSDDQRLVAYLVLEKGAESVAEMRKRLRAVLPDYMVPQQFIVLDSIPLTPNGKLDRKALPSPQKHMAGRPANVEPPQTPTEHLLAGIWKEIIGCESVSRTDNFFDLGGHSMMVIRAIARIEADTGWRPGPRLFILENLAEIALQCDQNGRPAIAKPNLFTKLRALLGYGGSRQGRSVAAR